MEPQGETPQAEEGEGRGTLYVVATPIGNLRDISLRAIDTLRAVDRIAAEDTRTTATLLAAHGIATPMLAAHRHNERAAAERIVALLARGESVALVSDAGTPAVSDPGALIVAAVRAAGFAVVPIPGANAAVSALSAAGIAATEFLFVGFLPAKPAARRARLAELRDCPWTLVAYEAPHRIVELAGDLAQLLGGARRVVLARELTKRFESIHACAAGEAVAWLEQDAHRQRGEFVVIVAGAPPAEDPQAAEGERVLAILLDAEVPVSQAASLAAKITGAKKGALYELALRMKPG